MARTIRLLSGAEDALLRDMGGRLTPAPERRFQAVADRIPLPSSLLLGDLLSRQTAWDAPDARALVRLAQQQMLGAGVLWTNPTLPPELVGGLLRELRVTLSAATANTMTHTRQALGELVDPRDETLQQTRTAACCLARRGLAIPWSDIADAVGDLLDGPPRRDGRARAMQDDLRGLRACSADAAPAHLPALVQQVMTGSELSRDVHDPDTWGVRLAASPVVTPELWTRLVASSSHPPLLVRALLATRRSALDAVWLPGLRAIGPEGLVEALGDLPDLSAVEPLLAHLTLAQQAALLAGGGRALRLAVLAALAPSAPPDVRRSGR